MLEHCKPYLGFKGFTHFIIFVPVHRGRQTDVRRLLGSQFVGDSGR